MCCSNLIVNIGDKYSEFTSLGQMQMNFVTTGLKCATTWFEQFLQAATNSHNFSPILIVTGVFGPIATFYLARHNGNTAMLRDTMVIEAIILLYTLAVIQMVIQMVMARNGDVPVARAPRFNGPFQSRRRGLNPIFQTFQSDVSDISIRSPAHNAIWWNPIPKYGRPVVIIRNISSQPPLLVHNAHRVNGWLTMQSQGGISGRIRWLGAGADNWSSRKKSFPIDLLGWARASLKRGRTTGGVWCLHSLLVLRWTCHFYISRCWPKYRLTPLFVLSPKKYCLAVRVTGTILFSNNKTDITHTSILSFIRNK